MSADTTIGLAFRSNSLYTESNSTSNEPELDLTEAQIHPSNVNDSYPNGNGNMSTRNPYESEFVQDDDNGHQYKDLHLYINTSLWVDE